MDWVFGNPDRHGGNVMGNRKNGQVMLIDHGTSFADESFSPGTDSSSFVPYYLRALCNPPMPSSEFDKLSVEQRMAAMPRLDEAARAKVSEWVKQLKPTELIKKLQKYDIDPGPSLKRLHALQHAALTNTPIDEFLISSWVR
jgi:hypothetical protein